MCLITRIRILVTLISILAPGPPGKDRFSAEVDVEDDSDLEGDGERSPVNKINK